MDLLAQALNASTSALTVATSALRERVDASGGLDAHQVEAFELARLAAEVDASEALVEWAGHGDLERRLTEVYLAQTFDNARAFASRFAPKGDTAELAAALAARRSTEFLADVGAEVLSRDADPFGARGLTPESEALYGELLRFGDRRLAPIAESIHRSDGLVPEEVLTELAELGLFGISIPSEHGGCFTSHEAVLAATEALSHASLGIGGSLVTRPEICAKALLEGGTDAQKAKWLPSISKGETMIAIAVTEPDAGSDVAALSTVARREREGYRLTGEKTWCTFAGRADALLVVARTGTPSDGHRGLTMFLVDKPRVTSSASDTHRFAFEKSGGAMTGHAIPTVGYRGMHSFSVRFDDWLVPDEQRIGDEGQGFYLAMRGFVGGRLQTAARAVGLMDAAARRAIAYVRDRRVFGQSLGAQPLCRARLAQMAARVQAGRQLACRVARELDEGAGGVRASLVKLLTCRDAEWVTREAMQLHGGMGYSEETAVSRIWLDARVLSIFEGAEEVLALRIIAPTLLGTKDRRKR